jgi:hypothetical protein
MMSDCRPVWAGHRGSCVVRPEIPTIEPKQQRHPQSNGSIASFMKPWFHENMRSTPDPRATDDEHLQIQVPSATKQDLALRAVKAREPIRMVVLRALDAYGVEVPEGAIQDRRRNRG